MVRVDLAALVVSLVALVGAGAGFLVSRRDRRADREDADRAAAESAARADRAEEIARRAVQAQEQMAAAQPVRQPWTLEHFEGDTYVLTCAASTAAYAVHLDLGQLGGVFGEVLDRDVMEPGEVLHFMTAVTMDVSDTTVTVSWAEQQGAAHRRTWKRPLPANGP